MSCPAGRTDAASAGERAVGRAIEEITVTATLRSASRRCSAAGQRGTDRLAGGAIRYLPDPQSNEKPLEVETETFATSHIDDLGSGGRLTDSRPLADRLAVRALYGIDAEPRFIDQDFPLREPDVSAPRIGARWRALAQERSDQRAMLEGEGSDGPPD